MTIRFGIIGFHHMHVGAMIQGAKKLDGIELVAIADHDPTLLAQKKAELNVPAYSDYREMIARERLDAVGICDIYDRRPQAAIDCLRAGISITADKPICLNPAHIEGLEAAWRSSNALLHLLLDKRFSPQSFQIKQLIDRGELGEIVSVYSAGPHPLLHRTSRPDWFFQPEVYGGILNDLAIHDLDLIAWYSGSPINHVQGFTGLRRFTQFPGFEDTGEAIARTANGTTGLVHVDWLTPDASPYWGDYRVYVVGSLGYAEAKWFPGGSLTVCTVNAAPREVELTPCPDSFSDFVTALKTGKEQVVTGEQVLAACKAAVFAQESARTGRPISL